MPLRLRLALVPLVLLPAALMAAESPPAAPATAPPAPASKPAAPAATPAKLKRLLEPRSGVELRMDARWQPYGTDTTTSIDWRLDGDADKGELRMRFPIHFADPPASAAAAFDLDRQLAGEQPDTVPKDMKELDNPVAAPTMPEGFQVQQHSFRFGHGRTRYLRRQFYITTPESKVIAATCTLPEKQTGADDACVSFLSTISMIPSRERGDRLSLLQTQEQRDVGADRYKVGCSVVNEEVAAWRLSNPTARLEQMPRFASLYSELMVKAFVGGSNRAIAEASQSSAAYIARIADTCRARPEATFGDAADSAK